MLYGSASWTFLECKFLCDKVLDLLPAKRLRKQALHVGGHQHMQSLKTLVIEQPDLTVIFTLQLGRELHHKSDLEV